MRAQTCKNTECYIQCLYFTLFGESIKFYSILTITNNIYKCSYKLIKVMGMFDSPGLYRPHTVYTSWVVGAHTAFLHVTTVVSLRMQK